jgi:hypothetical protein
MTGGESVGVVTDSGMRPTGDCTPAAVWTSPAIWGASTWIRVVCRGDQSQRATDGHGLELVAFRKVIICFAGVWVRSPRVLPLVAAPTPESPGRFPIRSPAVPLVWVAPPSFGNWTEPHLCAATATNAIVSSAMASPSDRQPATVSQVVGCHAFLTHIQVCGFTTAIR